MRGRTLRPARSRRACRQLLRSEAATRDRCGRRLVRLARKLVLDEHVDQLEVDRLVVVAAERGDRDARALGLARRDRRVPDGALAAIAGRLEAPPEERLE